MPANKHRLLNALDNFYKMTMSKLAVTTDLQIATLALLRNKYDATPRLVQSETNRSDDAICVYLELLERAKK